MRIYTNYFIEHSIERHFIDLRYTYFSIDVNKKWLYIFLKSHGYNSLDLTKCHEIIIGGNYQNHITLNDGKCIDILPKETSKSDLLNLLKKAVE